MSSQNRSWRGVSPRPWCRWIHSRSASSPARFLSHVTASQEPAARTLPMICSRSRSHCSSCGSRSQKRLFIMEGRGSRRTPPFYQSPALPPLDRFNTRQSGLPYYPEQVCLNGCCVFRSGTPLRAAACLKMSWSGPGSFWAVPKDSGTGRNIQDRLQEFSDGSEMPGTVRKLFGWPGNFLDRSEGLGDHPELFGSALRIFGRC